MTEHELHNQTVDAPPAQPRTSPNWGKRLRVGVPIVLVLAVAAIWMVIVVGPQCALRGELDRLGPDETLDWAMLLPEPPPTEGSGAQQWQQASNVVQFRDYQPISGEASRYEEVYASWRRAITRSADFDPIEDALSVADWALLAEMLAANEKPLALLDQARAQPHAAIAQQWVHPDPADTPTLSILGALECVEALTLRRAFMLRDGNAVAALADWLACWPLLTRLYDGQCGALTGSSIDHSCHEMMLYALEDVLAHLAPHQVDVDVLRAALIAHPPQSIADFRELIVLDRAMWHAHLLAADGLTPWERDQQRAWLLEFYRRALEIVDRGGSLDEYAALEAWVPDRPPVSYVCTITYDIVALQQTTLHTRAVQAGLMVIEAYHRNSRFPDALPPGDVSGAFGIPLIYSSDDAGFTITFDNKRTWELGISGSFTYRLAR